MSLVTNFQDRLRTRSMNIAAAAHKLTCAAHEIKCAIVHSDCGDAVLMERTLTDVDRLVAEARKIMDETL